MEFQRGIERLESKKSVITISERSISFSNLLTLFDNGKSNKVNNGDIIKKDKISFTKIDQYYLDQIPIKNNKVDTNFKNINKTKFCFTFQKRFLFILKKC
jgi:hypothetical protein